MLEAVSLLLVAGVALGFGAVSHAHMRAQARSYERALRVWEAERRNLLDRIMFLSERPWTPPPSGEIEVVEPEEELYYPERDLVPFSLYEGA